LIAAAGIASKFTPAAGVAVAVELDATAMG
jgi:hypothetical protein